MNNRWSHCFVCKRNPEDTIKNENYRPLPYRRYSNGAGQICTYITEIHNSTSFQNSIPWPISTAPQPYLATVLSQQVRYSYLPFYCTLTQGTVPYPTFLPYLDTRYRTLTYRDDRWLEIALFVGFSKKGLGSTNKNENRRSLTNSRNSNGASQNYTLHKYCNQFLPYPHPTFLPYLVTRYRTPTVVLTSWRPHSRLTARQPRWRTPDGRRASSTGNWQCYWLTSFYYDYGSLN